MKPQFSSVPMEILRSLKLLRKGNEDNEVIPYIERLQNFIKDTTHFEHPTVVGDFPDEWTALIVRQASKGVRLPYSPVSISYEVGSNESTAKMCAVYTNNSFVSIPFVVEDGKPKPTSEDEWPPAEITLFFEYKNEKIWRPCNFSVFLNPDDFEVNADNIFHTCQKAIKPLWVKENADLGPHEELFRAQYGIAVLILLSVLTALDEGRAHVTMDSKREIVKSVASKIGKKRVKSFYDIHRLTINPIVTRTQYEPKGGTHASPRWHKRRGYWRTMKKSGKVVWVQACEVGKKSDGMVYKDYEVKLFD